MYEVQNRSIDEHEQFSFQVERSNLRWLYNANLDFVTERVRVNEVENAADIGSLKGAIFKRKLLSEERLKSLGAFGLAGVLGTYSVPLGLMVGPTLPAVGIAASLLYGISHFSENNYINSIKVIKEGEHAGLLNINVAKSPFVSHDIIASP